jgi:hypothetical protein
MSRGRTIAALFIAAGAFLGLQGAPPASAASTSSMTVDFVTTCLTFWVHPKPVDPVKWVTVCLPWDEQA